ncbi:porin family protein [Algibacter luteus]|uniref:Outer membrane protein beta-barrel domain-containing protein n=1 Tax=Algibacter luteus TaxID=1178825 RepID=A0A1M6AAR8_9FLAO|nr:porin family protein [Algibacter luteus]SHI33526.1 Outer membrane protein beta-barrel domain-containing protein [Algibacter luteus]
MKTILKIVFIFSIVLNTNAQTHKSNTGIKGGYNLAAVSFDGETETGQRHAFHIGFYGESFLSESVALQIELLYSQQGYELKDGGGTFTQKLDYLNLPFLFKLYPDQSFFLEVGPQVGIAVSHKEEFDSNFGLFDTSQEFDPQNFDWGMNFGAGFKTESGVSLGVRYHLGLGSVYDEGNPHNRVWQFSIGFDF